MFDLCLSKAFGSVFLPQEFKLSFLFLQTAPSGYHIYTQGAFLFLSIFRLLPNRSDSPIPLTARPSWQSSRRREVFLIAGSRANANADKPFVRSKSLLAVFGAVQSFVDDTTW